MFGKKLSKFFGVRIGLFGTDDFGVAILKRIHTRTDVDFIKVFTTPDNSYKSP